MAWLLSLFLAAAEAEAAPALLGLEPKEVQALLGEVSFKRWEGAAQMMQFTGDACILDVYFYEEAPGAAFRAAHLAARNSSGETVEAEACFRALLDAQKAR
ncbi:MAG TPA: hypothetical protein VD713_02405 [Sphingomonadales bacterium]|nr:hypothetical protein [Sphingomonadales bacterium]